MGIIESPLAEISSLIKAKDVLGKIQRVLLRFSPTIVEGLRYRRLEQLYNAAEIHAM